MTLNRTNNTNKIFIEIKTLQVKRKIALFMQILVNNKPDVALSESFWKEITQKSCLKKSYYLENFEIR